MPRMKTKRDFSSRKANKAINQLFSQEVKMKIVKGKQARPQRIVLSGVPGIGKSTLASKTPDAVFIDTEGSTDQLDIARLPRPESWDQLLDEIDFVIREKPCKTLVIDSIDWAEQLCVNYVCQKNKKNSIEDFGYGKGYQIEADEFSKVLKKLDKVIEQGITVLLVAHIQIKKFEQPEAMGAYDRYELKLSKKAAPLVTEWADAVLFANYDTKVVEVNGKKKAIGGDRILHTQRSVTWDAKNRHGLEEEIPFTYEAIKELFINVKPAKKEEAVDDHDLPFSFEPLPIDEIEAGEIPEDLKKAMEDNEVTASQIMAFVEEKGWQKEGTPIAEYPDKLIKAIIKNITKITGGNENE